MRLKLYMRWRRVGEYSLVSLLLVTLCTFFLFILQRSAYVIDLSYNEGWNAYIARFAAMGVNIYKDPFIAVNYPPLSFFIVGFISKIGYDPLFIGRFLSCTAIAVILICIYVILRQQKASSLLSLFATLFFLQLLFSFGQGYVGVDDPQLLGNAMQLCALLLYVYKRNTFFTILSAVLCCSAIFIKVNLVAIPIVLLLESIVYKKEYKLWALAAVVTSVVGVLMVTLYNPHAWYWIVVSHGIVFRKVFLFIAFSLLYLLPAFLLCSIHGFMIVKGNSKMRMYERYFMCSFVLGIIFILGSGVWLNAVFDLLIATTLLLPKLLSADSKGKNTLRSFTTLVQILFFVTFLCTLLVNSSLVRDHYTKKTLRIEEQAFLHDTAFLSTTQGMTLCETLALCYKAGEPYTFQPLLINQYGRRDISITWTVLSWVDNKKFSIIQLKLPVQQEINENTNESRFDNGVLHAMQKVYHLVAISPNGYFYQRND